VIVGLLIGEGHFGGDGRQPQVTLRMHVRHAPLFRWIERTFPGGKLYGPYNHDGRHYLQWMARGSYLRDVLVPLLDNHLSPQLDAKSAERYAQMKARYQQKLSVPGTAILADPAGDGQATTNEEQREQPPKDLNDRSRAAEIFDRIRREQAI
jgi:hypothetical protein